MKYFEPGFELTLAGTTLTWSGNLEKADYKDIDTFLRQVEQILQGNTCTIVMRDLIFLNSGGIRSLATFILGSPKIFEIHINPKITWQVENIPILQHLKSKGIKIVS